jgi:ribosomal protein L3
VPRLYWEAAGHPVVFVTAAPRADDDIMSTILAKKQKMTQIWDHDMVQPVTVLSYCGPDEALSLWSELSVGSKVNISAVSKGKGHQGVVKRHGFGGGPQSHGQKNRLRAPGSIGNTSPQRVIKGRRMAGHMGHERVTVRNLTVIAVDAPSRTLFVKGAVPGMRGTIVRIFPALRTESSAT